MADLQRENDKWKMCRTKEDVARGGRKTEDRVRIGEKKKESFPWNGAAWIADAAIEGPDPSFPFGTHHLQHYSIYVPVA